MDAKAIPPMPLLRALLFFGLPLILMTALLWGLIPLMDLMGVRLFISFLTVFGAPPLLFLLLSLRFYRKEGFPWSWDDFRKRFRLQRMTLTDWLWTVALAVFLVGSYQLLSFTSVWISETFPQPKFMIRMFEDDPSYFMELPMKGNWFLFSGMLMFVLVKVLGHEFWFRGYILPRQEIVHGKSTWLVHGLLWSAVHLFMPWQLLQLLSGSFALSFVVQRRRNTWAGIVAHSAMYVSTLFELMRRII